MGNRPDQVVARGVLPKFKRPRFARLRLWVNEVTLIDSKAAQLRWAIRNAAEPQVCRVCKGPATVMLRDGWQTPLYGGPVFYACDEHSGVPLDVPNGTVAERICMDGCGWRQLADESGYEGASTGPSATSHCQHRWGPLVSYAPVP